MPFCLQVKKWISLLGPQALQVPPGHLPSLSASFQAVHVLLRTHVCGAHSPSGLPRRPLWVRESRWAPWDDFGVRFSFWALRMRPGSGSQCTHPKETVLWSPLVFLCIALRPCQQWVKPKAGPGLVSSSFISSFIPSGTVYFEHFSSHFATTSNSINIM